MALNLCIIYPVYLRGDIMENKGAIKLSMDDFSLIKKKFRGKEVKSGGYSDVYFSNDKAYKVYNKVPCLKNNYGDIIFSEEDVIKNISYFKENNFESISNISNIYFLNGFLVMYEMENISNMKNMKEINENNFDISLDELKSSWNDALSLALELANKNIVMYDLKEDNAFIGDGKFKVCDVDFYKKENINNVLNINYMLVNTVFIEFIERYLFFYNYECRCDDYLIETKNYVDSAIDDMLLASSYLSKTLKDVGKNL